MIDKCIEICNQNQIHFKSNFDLRKFSYSRTGNIVKLAIFPSTQNELIFLVKTLKEEKVSFKIVGASTNLLFLDSIHYNCFIYTTLMVSYEVSNNHIKVDSGRLVSDFVRDVAMRSYGGFEGLEGIPGTIGGALIMNAGAYGYTISDKLISVDVIAANGKIEQVSKAQLTIKNRSITNLANTVILSAKFQLQKAHDTEIERKIRRFHISRHQYQEWVYPNLGSIYIVPSMNINEDMRKIHLTPKVFRSIFYTFLFKVWYCKPLFFIRRSFPEFNFPYKILKHLQVQSYQSEISSNTTVNTFTNKNRSTLEILEYMLTVFNDTKGQLHLENEICEKNIFAIVNKDIHHKEKDILRKISCLKKVK